MKAPRFGTLLFVLVSLAGPLGAQTDRRPWAEAAGPEVLSVVPKADDPSRLVLTFTLVTGPDGADRAVVDFQKEGAVLESRTLGKTKNDVKSVEFVPPASGVYRFRISAYRTGAPESKTVTSGEAPFVLPLAAPEVTARNLGGGTVQVTWKPVSEATAYSVEWQQGGKRVDGVEELTSTSTLVRGLVPGLSYQILVKARRGTEERGSTLVKLVKAEVDREWAFTWFGQSSNANLNKAEVLDSDNLRLKLWSATFLPNGQIDAKGGKFTTFHDGISFYYTPIDPAKENFELTATFTVDAINPVPDGQEGFGLLVLDSLGGHGVNMVNHYTNSAGILATKFEGMVEGVKRTSKDTLGVRFVSGITPQVLGLGDSGIAQNGRNVSTAFSYETADLVKQGGVYTLTLKKTNTGYHVVYNGVEHILYGADKLAALDPARDYLGFAAARGCNVTVSDVRLTFTDVKTDPPGREEPPVLVPLAARVDAASATGSPEYPLVFTANAAGKLTLTDDQGRVLAGPAEVAAGGYFRKVVRLKPGKNDFGVRFEVDPGFRPAPRSRIAEASAQFVHTVYHRTYPGPVIHVTPGASAWGEGTRDKPVSLALALSFAAPGQTILLAEGTYRPRTSLVVERGNDGTPDRPIRLAAAPGERPILDFQFSTGGLQIWGSHWVLEGFDVTGTPGNVKGLQIAGHRNVVRNVQTYLCGDTGLQISGAASDPVALWPAGNLIENCTSWGNNDPAQNNADGFAAKLTCGPGNVFRGCIAYSNIDDGWDLFSKIESGPIGAVLIESCVAYRNGSLPDGSGNGDGNGFKLGGDGIVVPHVLRHSVAFDNGASGITSNSDPAVVLENNTSFANRGANINLYGKGDGARQFQARGNLSLKGGSSDVYREMPELASVDNYFWTGAQSLNSEGRGASADWFVHTDVKQVPGRKTDGSIDMKGLLVLTEKAAPGVGAKVSQLSR